jgi:outer membrane protein assembly factor BamD (BamD/ComL family)
MENKMKRTMKNYFLTAGLMAMLTLVACQSPREKAIDNIKTTEKEVFSENGMIDRDRVDELIGIYIGFADEFPRDSLAPEYIFKAADIAMNTKRSREAVRYYDRILNDYPDYRKTPEALFLKGYVYENNLGRLDKAKEIYEAFIEKYPDNEFADDAEVSLKFLGKSPEELIKIFQEEGNMPKGTTRDQNDTGRNSK